MNNLYAKFQPYRETEMYYEEVLESAAPSNGSATFAVDTYIAFVMDVAKMMGHKLDYNTVFADFLGYGSNDVTNQNDPVATLNNQLIPLIFVTMSMRKSLGLPQS